jgi:formylglycine-generating enzyme required for sulfatase activity
MAVVLLLNGCLVHPDHGPVHDAASDGAVVDSGLDALVCPEYPEDASCTPATPLPSDASVDPGDATCVHPPVVEDCVDGWCRIPAGCFVAGSPPDEVCRGPYSENQVQVFLTHPILITQTEVTQAEWEAVGFPNPGRPEGCADCPINLVGIFEAFAYSNALSEIEGLELCYNLSCCHGTVGAGCLDDDCRCVIDKYSCEGDVRKYASPYECRGYRLPTSPEWEYAARAGTSEATYNGEPTNIRQCVSDPVMDPIAWHCGSTDHVMPVGLLQPNDWGLHDMLGNLFEWVDYHTIGYSLDVEEGREGPLVNPIGPGPEDSGVEWRGGNFWMDPCRCKSAVRLNVANVRAMAGFRLVRTLFE